jgi:hypothetical protein
MSVNEAANHEFLAPELGLKFVRPISHQSKSPVVVRAVIVAYIGMQNKYSFGLQIVGNDL